MGGSPLGQRPPWRSPISSEAREGPRGPRHAEERLPHRSQTNRRWSLRVTCSWPLPPWAAEVGPAQHHFSRSGVPHYRHARPGGTTDGDGTDHGERLATFQKEYRYGQTRGSHHSRHVPREARITTQRLSGLWESARPKTQTAPPRAWYYPRRSRRRWRRTDLLQLEINRTLRWCRRKREPHRRQA